MRKLIAHYLGDRWCAALGEAGCAQLEEMASQAAMVRASMLFALPTRTEEAPALAAAVRRLQRFLQAKRDAPIPVEEEHQLKVLEAARELRVDKERLLEVYTACASISMKSATLFADALSDDCLGLAGNLKAEALHAAKWLSWRRAEREKKLRISVTLPEAEIAEQLMLRLTTEEGALALPFLQEHLRAQLKRALDERALQESIEEAARSYRGLLTSAPNKAEKMLSFFVGAKGQAIGAILFSKQKIMASRRFEEKPGWQSTVCQWLEEFDAESTIVPTSAPDQARLRELRGLLSEGITSIKPAGLSEARAALRGEDTKLPKEIASALILARRATNPFEGWSSINPLALGLAEYQNDLPEAELKMHLEDTIAACAKNTETSKSAPPVISGRLNPLLRSISDLKPGMQIEAEVVNLTSFGAFVSMGLETEGLIHISEIAEQRIVSPSEVLRIGQRVRPKVLSVDLKANKVSLSLREKSKGAPQSSKADALAKLKKAFG